MKAAPDAQLRLLDVQALDTRLGQLAHRRAALPELAELADLDKRLAALRTELVRAETEDGDLARDQTKVENEVDVVRSRAVRDRQRLDAGQVSSPRELQNLQHEIESLGKRQADLEDQVLEVMERRDALQARLAAVRDERDRLLAAQAEAMRRRDEAFVAIDEEEREVGVRRGELAGGLPGDLVDLYEKIRASSGVGAAVLHRGQCQGCHLSLSGSDLAAVRAAAADDVVRCEECRRILVRTAESGL